MSESIKAVVKAVANQDRVVASVLVGLGFQVERAGDRIIAEGSSDLWRDSLGICFPETGNLEVPSELADIVSEISPRRPRR